MVQLCPNSCVDFACKCELELFEHVVEQPGRVRKQDTQHKCADYGGVAFLCLTSERTLQRSYYARAYDAARELSSPVTAWAYSAAVMHL